MTKIIQFTPRAAIEGLKQDLKSLIVSVEDAILANLSWFEKQLVWEEPIPPEIASYTTHVTLQYFGFKEKLRHAKTSSNPNFLRELQQQMESYILTLREEFKELTS